MSRRSASAAVTVETPRARPLLKWAGGKAWLTDKIKFHLPDEWIVGDPPGARYFEPFMGGAALFWALRPRRAVLSDANAELVDMYRAVRDDVERLIRDLSAMQDRYHDSSPEQRAAFYYEVRDAREPSPARTIFLNKAGFNGLYRVNRDGGFNVPHGRTASGKPPVICDAESLRACSAALRGVELVHADYRSAMDYGFRFPRAGDLVYLDPPYEPEPGKASFTAYTRDYGPALQDDVAHAFRELAARGVYVLASNSDTPRIRELYAGFKQITVYRANTTSSKVGDRGRKVPELLIVGWERS